MVTRSPVATSTEKGHDLVPDVVLKLATTVRGEPKGDTEPGDPSSDEGVGDGVGSVVRSWRSLRLTCEAITQVRL